MWKGHGSPETSVLHYSFLLCRGNIYITLPYHHVTFSLSRPACTDTFNSDPIPKIYSYFYDTRVHRWLQRLHIFGETTCIMIKKIYTGYGQIFFLFKGCLKTHLFLKELSGRKINDVVSTSLGDQWHLYSPITNCFAYFRRRKSVMGRPRSGVLFWKDRKHWRSVYDIILDNRRNISSKMSRHLPYTQLYNNTSCINIYKLKKYNLPLPLGVLNSSSWWPLELSLDHPWASWNHSIWCSCQWGSSSSSSSSWQPWWWPWEEWWWWWRWWKCVIEVDTKQVSPNKIKNTNLINQWEIVNNNY